MIEKKGCYRNRKEVTEGKEGSENDFFPTYHELTRVLLNEIEFKNTDIILEPCAGDSDITKVIKERYNNKIIELDINPQNENIIKLDYLKEYKKYLDIDIIITNPPFKLSIEFFECFIKTKAKRIFLLMPLDYLHGNKRQDIMYSCDDIKLKCVYAFIRRPLFDKKNRPDCLIPTGATSFAWFEFEQGYNLDPIIKWLKVETMGVPTEKEQILFSDIA